jgi:hypothetical protein
MATIASCRSLVGTSHGLHLIIKERQMKPIAYTCDWGIATDLGGATSAE